MRYLIVVLLFASCSSGDPTGNDISGAYVRFAEGDFSKSWDTLIIGSYDAKGGTYVVQQRTGFQRIRDGKLQPKEYEKKKAMLVFDESTRQLQDMKTGLLYSFPAENKLLAGHAEYVKIN